MFRILERYPDYEINEKGTVRRKDTKIVRKTFPVRDHNKIVLNGKTEYISRLVAETFIPNEDNKSDVRHIDGNRRNDMLDNLEWATHSEIQKESRPSNRYQDRSSKQIRILETNDIYPSIRSCAKAIGGTPSGIRQCLNGTISVYKGFHFEIIE